MTRKDYQEVMAERFLAQNDSIVEFTRQIKDSLLCLNDNSTLHSDILKEQKIILKEAVETNKKNTRNFWIAFVLMLLAIISLSGAKISTEILKLLI